MTGRFFDLGPPPVNRTSKTDPPFPVILSREPLSGGRVRDGDCSFDHLLCRGDGAIDQMVHARRPSAMIRWMANSAAPAKSPTITPRTRLLTLRFVSGISHCGFRDCVDDFRNSVAILKIGSRGNIARNGHGFKNMPRLMSKTFVPPQWVLSLNPHGQPEVTVGLTFLGHELHARALPRLVDDQFVQSFHLERERSLRSIHFNPSAQIVCLSYARCFESRGCAILKFGNANECVVVDVKDIHFCICGPSLRQCTDPHHFAHQEPGLIHVVRTQVPHGPQARSGSTETPREIAVFREHVEQESGTKMANFSYLTGLDHFARQVKRRDGSVHERAHMDDTSACHLVPNLKSFLCT